MPASTGSGGASSVGGGDSGGSGGDDLLINIGVSIEGFLTGLQQALGNMQGFADSLGAIPMPDVFAPVVNDINDGEQWITDEAVPAFTAAMQAMADSVGPAFAGVTEAIVGPIREAISEINGLIGSIGGAGGASGIGVSASLPGFAEGGYTGSGPSESVAGIVHKGEYVVPQNGALVVRDDGTGGGKTSGQTVHINGPIYVQGVQDAAAMLDSIMKEAQRRNKPLG